VRPLPYTNSGAGIAFYAILVTFAILELRVRLRSVLNRHGSRTDRGSFAVLYVLIMAGVGGAFALAASAHGAAISFARWPIFIIGAVLMATGVAIRQWAVVLLGRYFTTDVRVHQGQTIVESGPYRCVRHPSYSGLLMTLVGIGLALGNGAALATLVILPSAGLILRIRVEERALLEALGEPYRRFANSRSRLIPRVW
jgi:protein-S-isoprenylcysteine O-methyltransferase Ste14